MYMCVNMCVSVYMCEYLFMCSVYMRLDGACVCVRAHVRVCVSHYAA